MSWTSLVSAGRGGWDLRPQQTMAVGAWAGVGRAPREDTDSRSGVGEVLLGTVDLQMFRVVGGLASVDTGEPDGAEAGTVPVGEELCGQALRRGAHVHP